MGPTEPANYGKRWTRDELILAFELYCRVPFQRTKASNVEVQTLASVLSRSPASVARKLGNFGEFDPQLRAQQISGLTHTSKLDKEIWDEFHDDWNGLVLKAFELRRRVAPTAEDQAKIELPTGPSERIAQTRQRIHQAFFRDAVLSSYQNTCCITGITVTECLTASHIVPWSVEERYRADPENGICLSATFDRLFDRGLITVTAELQVAVSKQLLTSRNRAVARLICCYDGRPILKPTRFMPNPERLEWHRRNVFVQ